MVVVCFKCLFLLQVVFRQPNQPTSLLRTIGVVCLAGVSTVKVLLHWQAKTADTEALRRSAFLPPEKWLVYDVL